MTKIENGDQMPSHDTNLRAPSRKNHVEEEPAGSTLFDNAAEAAAVACVMYDNSLLKLTQLKSEDFYGVKHGTVFTAVCAVAKTGVTADAVTVLSRLRTDGVIGAAGGEMALDEYYSTLPTAANFVSYAKVIMRLAALRKARQILRDCADYVENTQDGFAEIRASVNQQCCVVRKILGGKPSEYAGKQDMVSMTLRLPAELAEALKKIVVQ